MKEFPSNPQVHRFDNETRAAIIDAGLASATLTGGSTNDYNPTGLSSAAVLLIKVTTATQVLTGLVSSAVVGRRIHILCDAASTFNLVLRNADAGSSANNRFNLNGDLTLKPGQGMSFIWQAAYNGGNAGWRSVSSAFGLDGLIYSNGTLVDIVNITGKQTLFSFTVPGGSLGANGCLKIEAVCDFFNNSGATRTLTLEIAYGATVMYADVTTAQTAVATLRHPVFLDLVLSAANATNSQVLGGDIVMGTAAAATTGAGDIAAVIANATGFSTAITGTAAEDSTADKTLTVSITHATNNTSLSFRKLFAQAYIPGKGAKGDTGATGPAPTESIGVACSDETTALTTGAAKVTFRMPYAFVLTAVRAGLSTAQTSGSIFTVDINEGLSSILSTKLTVDNGERTSTTAATPPVISDVNLADDAVITVDVDQVGDGTAKGLKIWLIGHQ